MKEFPFPDLLASLDSESDKVEFMKACHEIGLNKADQEIGRLMRVLQLYKGYYETVPSEIRSVHGAALEEMGALRDEIKSIAARMAGEALSVGQWAEKIDQSLSTIQPSEVIRRLHNELTETTTAALSGSLKKISEAEARVDAATARLNAAARIAEASIGRVQTINLRRIWTRAFVICGTMAIAVVAFGWFSFFRHAVAWFYLLYVRATH